MVKVDGGLRHLGVWETEEDWRRFHDERSEPAVHQVLAEAGFTRMPPDPPVEVLELIDVSLGCRPTSASAIDFDEPLVFASAAFPSPVA